VNAETAEGQRFLGLDSVQENFTVEDELRGVLERQRYVLLQVLDLVRLRIFQAPAKVAER
jgi:hypothetical protein